MLIAANVLLGFFHYLNFLPHFSFRHVSNTTMAKSRATWIWLGVALVGAVLALAWPSIEQQLRTSGVPCPWPFTLFHTPHTGGAPVAAEVGQETALPAFTLEALKK